MSGDSLGQITRVRTATSYQYQISKERFTAIVDRDNEVETYAEMLCAQLEALDGVSDVEYNGHFGANIYLTVDADHDGSKTATAIFDLIWNYSENES